MELNQISKNNISNNIFEHAMLFCRRISDIRLVLNQVYDTSGRKFFILEWPRYCDSYIQSEYNSLVTSLSLKTFSNRTRVNCFLIKKTDYDFIKKSSKRVNYNKFRILRDYFVIQRILNTSEDMNLNITIEFRPSETDLSKYSNSDLNTSNKSLIDYLQGQEDVMCMFNTPDLSYKDKIRNYMLPLFFNGLGILPNKPIKLVQRPQRKKSIKPRAYILSEDKDQYNIISQTSFSNLMKLVTNIPLYDQICAIVKDFEQHKEGASF